MGGTGEAGGRRGRTSMGGTGWAESRPNPSGPGAVEFRKEVGAAGRGGARLRWAGTRAGPRVEFGRGQAEPWVWRGEAGPARWVGPERRVLYGAGFTARGGRALLLRRSPALQLHCLQDPGTRRPGGGGRRNAAMAPGELSGSAVLATAVFVGCTVSSPLVAPGECPIGAWALGRKRGSGRQPRWALSCPRPGTAGGSRR